MTGLKVSKKNEKLFDPHGKGTADALEAIRDPEVTNIKLVPCTVNGEQAVAIVAVVDRGKVAPTVRALGLRPLFVSITEGMVLQNELGEEPEPYDEHLDRVEKAKKKGGEGEVH